MTAILDDIITFFGSFILLAILMLVIAYMLVYQGQSNELYPMMVLWTAPLHYFIFRSD